MSPPSSSTPPLLPSSSPSPSYTIIIIIIIIIITITITIIITIIIIIIIIIITIIMERSPSLILFDTFLHSLNLQSCRMMSLWVTWCRPRRRQKPATTPRPDTAQHRHCEFPDARGRQVVMWDTCKAYDFIICFWVHHASQYFVV